MKGTLHYILAAGCWLVCCPAPSGRHEEMRPLWQLLFAEIQPGEILPEMCRSHEVGQGHGAQAETAAELSRFRGKKVLIYQGFPGSGQ